MKRPTPRDVLRSCAWWAGICVGAYIAGMAMVWTFQFAPDSNIAGGIAVGLAYVGLGGLWWRVGGQRDTTDAHHNWITGQIEALGELRERFARLEDHLGVDVHARDVDEGDTGPVINPAKPVNPLLPATEPSMPVVRPTPGKRTDTEEMAAAWDASAAQLVADVEMARSLAELEDRIWSWRERTRQRLGTKWADTDA